MSDSQPINYVRRRDRVVEDDGWIRAFLEKGQYGSVASECEGQPFINPVCYVYDAETHAIYFHTGRAGRIFANLTANPRVCFNVCTALGLEANPAAFSFTMAYESVNVFGRAECIEDEAEAIRALRLLVDRYFPGLKYGEDYPPMTPERLGPTAVWRIRVEAWSGKRNPRRT